MSTTKAPSRPPRQLVSKAKELPPELKKKAIDFYVQSKISNIATAKAKNARTKLFNGMKQTGIRRASFDAVLLDGTKVNLTAELNTPNVQYVDVKKLSKLVPMEKLLEIVSATQAAVTSSVGEAILRQCLSTGLGNENVKVGPTK